VVINVGGNSVSHLTGPLLRMLDYEIQPLEASVLTLMLSKMRAIVSLANLSSAASDCSDNESGCGNSELPARIGRY
jgi:hypothetical protein